MLNEIIEKKNELKDSLNEDKVQQYRRRMLAWDNPVEYVNNMYGCHPGSNGIDYFRKIYSN